MKKQLLALSFVLGFWFVLNAQTNISGFISANTAWNLAGSPYIVTGNALVSHGYTLTIEPGVTVKFNTDKALQIDGELIAIGTPKDRITFTSNQITPAPGDWAKIHFADTCVDAVFDASGNYVSGSIMKYCDVLYGGSLGFGQIQIETSNPYFNKCKIMYSSSAGIYSSESAYLLEVCSVKDCIGYGLYYYTVSPLGRSLFIYGDTISNNVRGGIFMAIPYGCIPVRIIDNYFSSNTTNGAIDFTRKIENVIIQGNYFTGNSSSLYGIITAELGSDNDTIRCNRFVNNQSPLGVLLSRDGEAYSGMIHSNIFDGNIGLSNGYSVLNLDSRVSSSPTYFFNNFIRNNVSVGGICCRIKPQLDDNQLLKIYNNEFADNTGMSVLQLDGYVTSNSNLNFLLMHSNNFSDTNSKYEFYNNIPYGSPNIYADGNYWGSTSTQHVDSVIYDYFDFANQSVVYYSPILTSPVVVDTTCAAFQTSIEPVEETHLALLIFPNPATNSITISIDETMLGSTAVVYDITGRKVEAVQLKTANTKLETSSFTSGVYFVTVENEKGRVTKKLVIEK